MISLDSNIFLYALLGQAPFEAEAISLLKKVENGQETAAFASLTYAEVLGKKPNMNLFAAHSFLDELPNTVCVPLNTAIAKRAGELRLRYPPLRLADATHLATAIDCRASVFITCDSKLLKIAAREIKAKGLLGLR